jgi:hypothetical protein
MPELHKAADTVGMRNPRLLHHFDHLLRFLQLSIRSWFFRVAKLRRENQNLLGAQAIEFAVAVEIEKVDRYSGAAVFLGPDFTLGTATMP